MNEVRKDMPDITLAPGIEAPRSNEEMTDWIYYDLVASGTTASAKKTFFTHKEGTDGLAVTNLPTEGQLPSTERMSVESIQLVIDPEAADGDMKDLLDAAVLEFYIAGKRKYSAPAKLFCANSWFAPGTAATTVDKPGLAGTPLKFDIPFGLNGGTSFKVEVTIGKTAASATTDITVCLVGKIIKPRD